MNKLLSAAAASTLAVLIASSAAQAAEVMTDKQMDTITAGATFNLPASSFFAYAQSNTKADAMSDATHATATAAPGTAFAGHCNGNCAITLP